MSESVLLTPAVFAANHGLAVKTENKCIGY
jgi:hypothetical protein